MALVGGNVGRRAITGAAVAELVQRAPATARQRRRAPGVARCMNNDALAEGLALVLRGIESDVPYGPDRDATIDELEEIETDLIAERAANVTIDRPAYPQVEATAA